MAKKEKGDLPDLGEKAKFLLLKLKTEGPEGAWDANAQKGLFAVFNNAIDELRLVSKNDPETYLKFTRDKAAQERILSRALQRSGAEEGELKTMVQCMVP